MYKTLYIRLFFFVCNRQFSFVSFHLSIFICQFSFVSFHLTFSICQFSFVIFHLSKFSVLLLFSVHSVVTGYSFYEFCFSVINKQTNDENCFDNLGMVAEETLHVQLCLCRKSIKTHLI